jgi:pimeloyl-ACP methyl ester carboxylesterase
VTEGEHIAGTEFLLALMDALDLERAHLIGNSMGSMTISKFAVQHPQYVESLVLSGGEPRITTDALREIGSLAATPRNNFVRTMFADHAVNQQNLRIATADFFHDRAHPTIDHVADLRRQTLADEGVYRRAEEGVVRQLERKSSDTDTTYLSEIAVPVFLLHGRDESWFYPNQHRDALTDAAMKAAKVIPNCTTTFLPFCGHWPQLESADRYNALVGEFLKTLAPSR